MCILMKCLVKRLKLVKLPRINGALAVQARSVPPGVKAQNLSLNRSDNWEFSVYSHFCAQILIVRGRRRSGSAEFCQRFDERLPNMAEAGDPIPKLGYGFSIEKPRG